jgi:TonB family protein
MPGPALQRVMAGAAVLAMIVSASPVAGQAVPIRGDRVTGACKLDPSARPDTSNFTLHLAPPRIAQGGADLSSSYAPFLYAVASAFKPPTGITMDTWPGTSYISGDEEPDAGEGLYCGVGPMTGQVQFRLKKGRVRDLAWELLPDSREVTRAVQDAIHRADSMLDFVGLRTPPGQPGGLVRLTVTMTAGKAPDGAIPVLRIRMPYVAVDSPVEVIEMAKPSYPAVAARRRIEGDVIVQYVVDEDGRVRRESIRVVEANYQDFAEAAADAIVASRYRPARLGDCSVKLLVQQRIRFKMR